MVSLCSTVRRPRLTSSGSRSSMVPRWSISGMSRRCSPSTSRWRITSGGVERAMRRIGGQQRRRVRSCVISSTTRTTLTGTTIRCTVRRGSATATGACGGSTGARAGTTARISYCSSGLVLYRSFPGLRRIIRVPRIGNGWLRPDGGSILLVSLCGTSWKSRQRRSPSCPR